MGKGLADAMASPGNEYVTDYLEMGWRGIPGEFLGEAFQRNGPKEIKLRCFHAIPFDPNFRWVVGCSSFELQAQVTGIIYPCYKTQNKKRPNPLQLSKKLRGLAVKAPTALPGTPGF